jgi:Tol biopolymer transport system component
MMTRTLALLLTCVPTLTWAQATSPATTEAAPDDASLYVVVEASQRQIDGMLVLAPFCQGVPRPTCDTIEQVMANDTRLSGFLRAVHSNPGLFAGVVKTPLPQFSVRGAAAVSAGAAYVLGTLVKPGKDAGTIELHARLVDARSNKAIDLGDTQLQVSPAGFQRHLAHRVLNAVQGALTGVEGSFDTSVYYSAPIPGKCNRAIWQADADGANRRVLIADGGKNCIHMFPMEMNDGGLMYMSFRTDAPSLFKLDPAQLMALTDLTPALARGQKLKKASLLPKNALEQVQNPLPFARGEIPDRQYRGCSQNARGELVCTINDGDQADLWRMDWQGQPEKNLTNAESDELSPVFSPDGAWVAYVSNKSGGPQVYVMDAEGGSARRLSWVGPYNTDPDWGPDGRIAYSGMRSNAIDILTIDLQGHAQRLTPGQGRRSLEPSWSPDGKRLVYVSDEDGKCTRLWITAADGAAREPLDMPCDKQYSTPLWQRLPGSQPRRWTPHGNP